MQNFGKIKNAFNDILIESIIAKDDSKKAIFSQFIKAIKENKILKAQYLIYSNLEDKAEVNETKAADFVKANIEFLKGIKKSDIEKANQVLVEKLGNLKKRLDKPYNAKQSKLHEDVTKLIFTKNHPSNIDIIHESIDNVVSYIKENKPKETIKENLVPTNAIATIAINKFNEKYSDLDENERYLLKTIMESDEQVKENNQKQIVSECISLIETKLTESDENTKDKLLKAKEKLSQIVYNPDNYADNVSKLVGLKNDLMNN